MVICLERGTNGCVSAESKCDQSTNDFHEDVSVNPGETARWRPAFITAVSMHACVLLCAEYLSRQFGSDVVVQISSTRPTDEL